MLVHHHLTWAGCCVTLCGRSGWEAALVVTGVRPCAKLSNEHFNVTVKPMPGARIARMKNVNYADADVVIVHAGTCNLKKQSDPEELADEIVSTLRDIKSKGNKAQVAFSGIIKRKDDLELNAKAIKTNEIIVEKLMYSGWFTH